MAQFIRAEDFHISGDRMILGGRVFEGNAIVFAHAEKRVSLELIGFCSAIAICVVSAIMIGQAGVSTGLFVLALILFMGACREIARPYVLVVEIFQFGLLEVRGFTRDEIIDAEDLVDDLRRGNGARRVGHMAGVAGY